MNLKTSYYVDFMVMFVTVYTIAHGLELLV